MNNEMNEAMVLNKPNHMELLLLKVLEYTFILVGFT